MELELQLEAPEVQEGSYAAQHLAGQSRSASIDFQVEKAADLYELKRSASQPTLRGATSPVTRLQIEVKPAGSPAAAWLSTTTEAEGATLGNDCSAPQPPPCTPRGSRAGSKLLDPPGSRAMCFDFDLTLECPAAHRWHAQTWATPGARTVFERPQSTSSGTCAGRL